LSGTLEQKVENIARHVFTELREEDRKEMIHEQKFREEKGRKAYPPEPKEKLKKSPRSSSRNLSRRRKSRLLKSLFTGLNRGWSDIKCCCL